MFLLVPAYPGCPGSKAVKRSLLLLLYPAHRPYAGQQNAVDAAEFDVDLETKV